MCLANSIFLGTSTRVVQKLIETLKTKQQISLVISALEPGFLALIKDLNGNHVIQRCLQCFPSEDSKVITHLNLYCACKVFITSRAPYITFLVIASFCRIGHVPDDFLSLASRLMVLFCCISFHVDC